MTSAVSRYVNSTWYRNPKIEMNDKPQELAGCFLRTVKCYIPVVKRNSLPRESFHPFISVTIETGNESRVVSMATGILDTGTACKIMA
jgi:hypothetical protein